MTEFVGFPKIPRLFRDVVITEKIDGTNACVVVTPDENCGCGDCMTVTAQSRKRVITPGNDNFAFADWVQQNEDELKALGPGYHFGEWWGKGIQRGYGLEDRRFSLFNVARWGDPEVRPRCCDVVPVLERWTMDTIAVKRTLGLLRLHGSAAAPGYMNPEGVVVYHTAGNALFKALLENDATPKGT